MGPSAPVIEVHLEDGAIELHADRDVRAIDVVAEDGTPVTRRTLPTPTRDVTVPIAPPPGAVWRLRAELRGGWIVERTVDGPALPVAVAIEAPVGQGRRAVVDGDRIEVWATPGTQAALLLTASVPGDVTLTIDGTVSSLGFAARGDRQVVPVPLDHERRIAVAVGDEDVELTLIPRTLDPEDAARLLVVERTWLPADPSGRRDPTLPADRIVLPPRGWRETLGRLGFGFRALPEQAPFTWQAVALENRGDTPIDVVLRAEVVGPDGLPSPAFRSRLRSQEDQPYVSAILRIPAHGSATGALPVYLDDRLVPEGRDTVFERRIAVVPLGADAPLHEVAAPLVVSRGRGIAPLSFLLACGTSAVGWSLLVGRHRRFLRSTSTADLVTIAMFAALTFVVGAAFQLVGMAVSTVLGPLAPLLTGLPDDAFRAVLLATLLTALPKPGVFAAAATVGFLMRGIVLGSFHPVDLLYVGTVIAVHEAGLWVAGITRGTGWRDGPPTAQWLRLTAGFGFANVVCVLLGLSTSAVLYRLYFATWYVVALAAIPGFLYVAIGCRLAVPIAASLRRIAP